MERSFKAWAGLGVAAALGLGVLTFASANPAEAATRRIVAFGDSLTAGFGLDAKDAFPAQLEAALKAKGYDVVVINAGVSGETAPQGLARLDWSVPHDADAVIVELGANDMLRGFDPQVTRDALTKITTRLKDRGLPVLLAGMQASRNLDADYRAKFDVIYPELAKEENLILYPFFLEGVAADRRYTLPDGLHPTREGVARIVAGILPQVEELVARAEERVKP